MAYKTKHGKNKNSRVVLLTAAKIAKGELEPLGKQIKAHVDKVQAYEAEAREKAGLALRKANDHRDSISQLLNEAKSKCDGGGFRAFKQKYCPHLGRSRIYELLRIGSGKTTVEASQAATRDRVQKHRDLSVTEDDVTDKSAVAPVEEVAAPVEPSKEEPPVSRTVSVQTRDSSLRIPVPYTVISETPPVSKVISVQTKDSSLRIPAPYYIEPSKEEPVREKVTLLGDGQVITSPAEPTEASAEASAEKRKGLNADLELPAGEKAVKMSAHYLAEFSAACNLYLPKVTVEEHRQEARLLVSKLTSTTPRLKTKTGAHRETQH